MDSHQAALERQGRPTSTFVFGGALAVALLYSFRFSTLQLLVDDAFISFRYAEALAQHGELVFNLGERVEGYSNLSWTLLLALGARLGIAPPVLAPLAGYLLGLATLATVGWCAWRKLDVSPEGALVAAGLVAIQPAWCFWSGGGLETPLFGLGLLALWATASFLAGWRGTGVAVAVAGLLALTRPEGALLAWLVVPALAVRGARHTELLAAAAVVATVIGAHIAWRCSYYGAWLPTPVVAKSALTTAGILRGLSYTWSYLYHEGVVFLLPFVVGSPRRKELATLWGLVLIYAAFVTLAGGDGLYRHRLLAHLTPLLIVGLAPAAQSAFNRKRTARALTVLGLAGNLTIPLALPGFFRDFPLAEVREWESRWTEVGRALNREMPTDTYLATNVVGRVPYYSRLPTLDLLGLTDPFIAASPVAGPGAGYAGHERAAPSYVLSREPDVLYLSVLDGLPFEGLRRVKVVRRVLQQGSLHRYAELLDDPRFVQRYGPAKLRMPQGGTANVFVRRAGRSGFEVQDWVRAAD